MRTLMTVRIPTVKGNAALKDGSLQRTLGAFMDEQKPEAAYFTVSPDGERSAVFVFDMADSSTIVAVSEPFFTELEAKITIAPVMNVEDLTTGLKQLDGALAAPA